MKKILLSILVLFVFINAFGQLRPVKNNQGKYGFVNLLGDTIVPPVYDYAEDYSEGLALVKKFKGYKLIDTLGNLWDISKLGKINGLRYDWGSYHSGMPLLVPIWECAYLDINGKVAIRIPYRDAESFHDNKAKVYKGDKYSYINRFGALMDPWKPVPDQYRAVMYKGFYGFVNKNGKLVIDYQFRKAYDFKNGVAKVSPDLIKWAIINPHGQYISKFYEDISDFDEDGVATVKLSGYYGFISLDGKFRSGWYQEIQKIDKGLYRVKKNESYAIVKNGYQVTKWYDYIERYNDKYWLAKDGDKYAFVNDMGAYVVGWYHKLWTLDNYPDLIFVKLNNKYGFYNISNYYISPLFDTLIFSEGIALVRQNGKYGFINQYGKKITDLVFDYATPFKNSVATVEKDNKVTYIDPQGNYIIDWINKDVIVKSPPPGLFVVKIGDKYGYQTLNGKRVIPAVFDDAKPFSEGLALVKRYPQWMYIDTTGKLLPINGNHNNPALRRDWGYQHTLKPVKVKVWGYLAYINPEGKAIIELPQDITNAESFVNGKAKVYKGDKYNYIDKQGNLIGQWRELPDDYHVAVRKGKFGFINKNNKIVIPAKFDYAYDFKNGLAKVQVNGKWTYINRKGEPITGWFDKVYDFKDGIAIVQNGDKYAIIDTTGKVLSNWYDKIYDFHDGLAKVKIGNKYSFITKSGKQLPLTFDDASDFSEGLAKVKVGNKWGFINKNGTFVAKPIYDWATPFTGGVAKVKKDGKFTLINNQGKQITDWFDRIYFFSNERAVVMKDGKWGYIDINGKIVIPLVYDAAYGFSGGKAMVVKDGKMYIIDKQGNIIQEVQ